MRALVVRVWGAALVLVSTVLETGQAVDHTECITSPAVVGGTGSMTFSFRPDVDMSLQSFFAYLQREGDPGNVLECDRRSRSQGVTCHVLNVTFQSRGVTADRTLTVTVSNVTRSVAGVYTLRTLVNNSWETPVHCTFTVTGLPNGQEDERKGREDKNDKTDNIAIIVPVVLCNVVVVTVAAILIVYFVRRRRRRQLDTDKCVHVPLDEMDHPGDGGDQADERTHGEAADLLKQAWYVGRMGRRDAARLLTSHGNDKGSFLIRQSAKDPDIHKLEVNVSGKVESFVIRREGGRYTLSKNGIGETMTFPDLQELVEYYSDDHLRFGNDVYVELKKPATKRTCSCCAVV